MKLDVRMIQIEKLVKHYQEGEVVTPVIEGLDLRIEEGEFVAIVGPSGSGKSTLLNLIGCLHRSKRSENQRSACLSGLASGIHLSGFQPYRQFHRL